jgi:vacuolar-type H+-ATPase subunit F/Vma7
MNAQREGGPLNAQRHGSPADGAPPPTVAVAYVGHPLDAAGLRLAGVLALAPQPGAEVEAFERACAAAQVVLLGAQVAERLPEARLARALAATQPLVALVPDALAPVPAADPAERARRVLGLEPAQERDA